jgi:hypothetical protein
MEKKENNRHPERMRRTLFLRQNSKVKTNSVWGKFYFSVFNLFIPENDVQFERFSFLQAPLLKKYKPAVRIIFPKKG